MCQQSTIIINPQPKFHDQKLWPTVWRVLLPTDGLFMAFGHEILSISQSAYTHLISIFKISNLLLYFPNTSWTRKRNERLCYLYIRPWLMKILDLASSSPHLCWLCQCEGQKKILEEGIRMKWMEKMKFWCMNIALYIIS